MKYFLLVSVFITFIGGANSQEKPAVRKVLFSELQNINEVYYFKGKPYTGISFETFDGRAKKQELEWKNGLLDGTKTVWFKNKNIIREKMTFKEGKRNGIFIENYPNGTLQQIGKYTNDLLDSTLTAFYPNGNIKYIFTYINGVKTGQVKSYFSNGNLEQSVYLIDGAPSGLMETYYEAGNIRMKGEYKNGYKNGLFLRYHLTGQVAEECYYKNNVKDSIALYWDNSFGNLMKQEHYKMGVKEGVWLTFNEFGDTITQYQYKNDTLNGPYKIYYSGGAKTQSSENEKKKNIKYVYELNEFGTYKMGKLDGIFKSGLYHRDAHVEGTFSEGIRIGEWYYYNEDDKLVLYEKYSELGELLEQKPRIQPTNK